MNDCDICLYNNICSLKKKRETQDGFDCIDFEDVTLNEEDFWEKKEGEPPEPFWKEMSFNRYDEDALDTELSEYDAWEW